MGKIEELEQQIALLKVQLELKEEQLKRKDEHILYLERQVYGRRSERRLPELSTPLPSLFDAAEGDPQLVQEKEVMQTLSEDIKQSAEKRRTRKRELSKEKGTTYKLPAHLERRETIVEAVPFDPKTMVRIGEDVTERLMLDPARFWVQRIVRPIYKIKETGGQTASTLIQAPGVQNILPGCMAGSSLLGQIVVDKFLSHIPEYRQVARFKSLGVEISTSTINRWVHALADRLYPLYHSQMENVLATDYIQVDETVLSITDRPGSARKGYVWAVRSVRRPGVFFYYDKGSRSQEVVLKMLKQYQGALQTDGYAAYSIYEQKAGVLPLGCMAHVRRKFENALATTPESSVALDYISLLYTLEENLRFEGANPEQIREERQRKAYPILQQMEQWMLNTFPRYTPQSPLGKAISYAFGMWPRICRYCKEGYFQIDNNGVENAIRPLALGRKNYLFSGNDSGAENNCVFYTLLGSCLQAGVDPYQWMRQTLERYPPEGASVDWNEFLP